MGSDASWHGPTGHVRGQQEVAAQVLPFSHVSDAVDALAVDLRWDSIGAQDDRRGARHDRCGRRGGGGGRFGAWLLAQARSHHGRADDYRNETGGQTNGQPADNPDPTPAQWSRFATHIQAVGCCRNGCIKGPQSLAQSLVEVIHRSSSQLPAAGDRAPATASSTRSLAPPRAPRRPLPVCNHRGQSAEERP